MKRQNITLDPEIYEKFIEIANKKGIKLSPWVNSKMKEFIEEEQIKNSKV
jgi:isopentenyldiphosphate isomerase